MKDIRVIAKPVNLLEENIGGNLHNTGFGGGVLDMTLKTQKTKE